VKAVAVVVACPQCGASLELVTDGQIGEAVVSTFHQLDAPPQLRWKRAPFAACPCCEFCVEIPPVRRASHG
jgi:hypothetical protein